MTNLEAADLLDNLIGMVSDNHDSDYDEALHMGRDLLEQEPVLDKIRDEIADIYCGQYCENPLTADAVREMALEIIDKYKAGMRGEE
jgi:hypothetical protein